MYFYCVQDFGNLYTTGSYPAGISDFSFISAQDNRASIPSSMCVVGAGSHANQNAEGPGTSLSKLMKRYPATVKATDMPMSIVDGERPLTRTRRSSRRMDGIKKKRRSMQLS